MKYKIAVSRKAASSLNAIYDYIARDNPSAAKRFVLKLEKQCHLLATFPRGYPKAFENGIKKYEIRNIFYSSYRIIYKIDGKKVEIIDIRHRARLPLTKIDS